MPEIHAALPPSPWVKRWAGLIRPGGSVLDVACGSGRHLRWLAAQGWRVTGVDRDREALAALAPLAAQGHRVLEADLEGAAWPLAGERFDGVVVTNYLWRPLFPRLREALAADGVLIVETFASGQQTIGRPSREAFLLQPGELLREAGPLRVVAFEDGFADDPPRFVQRLAAVAEAPGTWPPPRRPLGGGG